MITGAPPLDQRAGNEHRSETTLRRNGTGRGRRAPGAPFGRGRYRRSLVPACTRDAFLLLKVGAIRVARVIGGGPAVLRMPYKRSDVGRRAAFNTLPGLNGRGRLDPGLTPFGRSCLPVRLRLLHHVVAAKEPPCYA